MERATGFEPATSTLARWRATNCAKPATRRKIYVAEPDYASTNFKNLVSLFLAWKKLQVRGTDHLVAIHPGGMARAPTAVC
jgi:hypothetical protein